MNSLTTKQCISWAVREERLGVKEKKTELRINEGSLLLQEEAAELGVNE